MNDQARLSLLESMKKTLLGIAEVEERDFNNAQSETMKTYAKGKYTLVKILLQNYYNTDIKEL